MLRPVRFFAAVILVPDSLAGSTAFSCGYTSRPGTTRRKTPSQRSGSASCGCLRYTAQLHPQLASRGLTEHLTGNTPWSARSPLPTRTMTIRIEDRPESKSFAASELCKMTKSEMRFSVAGVAIEFVAMHSLPESLRCAFPP